MRDVIKWIVVVMVLIMWWMTVSSAWGNVWAQLSTQNGKATTVDYLALMVCLGFIMNFLKDNPKKNSDDSKPEA